jgi:hypothetical protein
MVIARPNEPLSGSRSTDYSTGGAVCLGRGLVFDNLALCLRRMAFPGRLVEHDCAPRREGHKGWKARPTRVRRRVFDRSRSRGKPEKAVGLAMLRPSVLVHDANQRIFQAIREFTLRRGVCRGYRQAGQCPVLDAARGMFSRKSSLTTSLSHVEDCVACRGARGYRPH